MSCSGSSPVFVHWAEELLVDWNTHPWIPLSSHPASIIFPKIWLLFQSDTVGARQTSSYETGRENHEAECFETLVVCSQEIISMQAYDICPGIMMHLQIKRRHGSASDNFSRFTDSSCCGRSIHRLDKFMACACAYVGRYISRTVLRLACQGDFQIQHYEDWKKSCTSSCKEQGSKW